MSHEKDYLSLFLVSASLNDFHIAGAVDFFLHTSYFVKTLISRGVSEKLKIIALEALERLRLSPKSIAFKINNMKLFLLENATNHKTRAVIAKVRIHRTSLEFSERRVFLSLVRRGAFTKPMLRVKSFY